MSALLVFALALALLVGLALAVNKATGTKAHYLEELALAPGERVLWEDDRIDAYVIDTGPQPLARSFAHLKRHRAVLTNLRLLWGQVPVGGGGRHLIERAVLLSRQAPGAAGLDAASGGLLGGGYVVYLADPAGLAPVPGGAAGELAWAPLPTPSASGVRELRLFVNRAAELQAALAALPGAK